MNERSSRSHCVFTMRLTQVSILRIFTLVQNVISAQTSVQHNAVLQSTVRPALLSVHFFIFAAQYHLVDLAGSERVKKVK